MALRWPKDDTDIAPLDRDAAVSIATSYRHLHEGIDVTGEQLSDLPDVLAHARGGVGLPVDGTLVHSIRSC